MSTSDYENLRQHIPNGSLIFFKAMTFKQKLVTWVTGGKYSHCGIAFWVMDTMGNQRLMLAEAFIGGCRLISLRNYANRDMLVIDVGLDWTLVAESIMRKTGTLPYSLIDFVTIGVKDLATRLGLRRILTWLPNAPGEVCSEMLANTLLIGGFLVPDTLISPHQLLQDLEDFGWIKHQFNITA